MNFSNDENVNIIVKLLKEHDVSDLVISPGGTNIPIIKAVQDDPFFKCYSVVDERSAAYVSIGIYIQKRKKIALICTSAQATRNYIPGLTEAFYKRIPIIAITMEKHPRFKYQEYMQAPDQASLPNDSVKKSFELPYISDINDYYHSIRVVNEAILETERNGRGPVQLCVPWLDFPMEDIKPNIRVIKRYQVDSIKNEDLSNKKILIVVGEHMPFSVSEKNALDVFCEKTNSVVYVNHLSNYSSDYTIEGSLMLLVTETEELQKLKPDILISIGGQTGDYPFYLAFSKNSLMEIEHWRICDDGNVTDTYDKLTRIYQGSTEVFFNNVVSTCNNHSFFNEWKQLADGKKLNMDVPFSQVSIAQYLHDKIPCNSIIQFSILNSLRIWNFFNLDPTIECYSNVGAFGIDGGLSTLIGQSIVSGDKLSFMIIGDLAFFYDMNVLSLRDVKNNVRILLVNNNGGIEFKLHGEKKAERDRYIAAANHRGSAKGWALSCGFEYYEARDFKEFTNCIPAFIAQSDKPILLEAFVSDYDESYAYLKIVEDNKAKTTKSSIKNAVKGILGDKNYRKIKNSIKG